MIIEGKILEIFQTQEIKESFKKREFVLEYAENPQYPEYIKFELIQANCEQLDNLSNGESVKVSFNLKGRKWTDPKGEVKYFNSLQAWRIEKLAGSTPDTGPVNDPEDTGWMKEDLPKDDDLPF